MSLDKRTLSLTVANEDYDLTNGTSFQGQIRIRYADLCRLFGPPGESDGYKVQAEWRLHFYDHDDDAYITATIYDWKMGEAYCGVGFGVAPQDIVVWHIGGRNSDAVDAVESWVRMSGVDCEACIGYGDFRSHAA